MIDTTPKHEEDQWLEDASILWEVFHQLLYELCWIDNPNAKQYYCKLKVPDLFSNPDLEPVYYELVSLPKVTHFFHG